nr:hypothetical protein [Tanacetum cinerariifolium]
MLDWTNFASRETLAESTEGIPQFGLERPRVYSDLDFEEKDRYNADIRVSNILLQGLPKDIYTLINHYTDAKDIWDNVKMLIDGSELTKEERESQLYDDFEHFRQHKEESIHDYYVRFVTAVKLNRGLRDSNYDQLFAYLKQHEAHAKENKMMLERLSQSTTQPTADPLALLSNVSNTEHGSPSSSTSSFTQLPPPRANSRYGEAQNRVGNVNQGQARPGQARTDLALNMDNVFQAEDCDAFDSDVDEAPTAQTMFMANLSSAGPITDEAGPSYDSVILSEVQDHDQYLDDTCAYQEEHMMHNSVQLDHVVDLHADYTSVSNMILYDQYVKDNEVPVVHSNESSVQNDTFMMIYKDMCEPSAPSMSNSSRNAVVKNSLTDELATYREQVELPLYNEQNKVAIGYKNPLCLTRAKQAQPALYNGHEILKDNHAPAKVHNTEDTLEIVEITGKKMNAKMTDPECVTHKVKIVHHDYLKENLLATFTPQKQLTPEQIYWSNDLMKLKSKALKERAKVSRPLKAFTILAFYAKD